MPKLFQQTTQTHSCLHVKKKKLKITIKTQAWGSFTNYVDRFLGYFDTHRPLVVSFTEKVLLNIISTPYDPTSLLSTYFVNDPQGKIAHQALQYN